MSSGLQQCSQCGRYARLDEHFALRRHKERVPGRKPRDVYQVVLCPQCEADYDEAGASGRSEQRCDQCHRRIPPGQARSRTKTDTDVAGVVAYHKTVRTVLCPVCAASYDGTGASLVVLLGVLLGITAVCGLLGLFFW